MTFFWVIVALLVIASLLFVLPALLQRAPDEEEGIARRDLNVVVHEDQLEELAADLANGMIDQEQYDLAKSDLERGLLEGVSNLQEKSATEEKSGKLPAIVVAVAVPVLAVGLYLKLGGGEHAFSPENAPMEVDSEQHAASIEEMVASLEDRMRNSPDDPEGWAMLGRSYYFMQRFDDAVAAYEKSLSVGGGSDAAVLADFADAYAMANGRSMAGRPYELVKRALQINPVHEKALWLAGTAAYQLEDYRAALGYWEKLLTLFDPSSENGQMIRNNVNDLRAMLGEPALAATPQAVEKIVSVSGEVRLAPQLKSKVSPEDTVFVFARAQNGPRMPLAIIRKQVKDLPFSFTLDDTMAMNPSFKLSSFSSVEVGARVSKSGQAMPESGDLECFVPVKGNGDRVEVIISSQRP